MHVIWGAWRRLPTRDASRKARTMTDLPELPPNAFAKQDPTDDTDFYAPARLVTHIDDDAVAARLEDVERRVR